MVYLTCIFYIMLYLCMNVYWFMIPHRRNRPSKSNFVFVYFPGYHIGNDCSSDGRSSPCFSHRGHRFWMSSPFHHHGDRDTEAISFFKKGHPIQRVPGLLSWEIRGMSHSVCPLLRNDFFLWWSFFVRHLDCVCGRVTRYEFAFEYQMAVVLVINFWHWWLNHPNSDLVKPS